MVQREELEESKLLQEKILGFMHTFKFKKVEELADALRRSDDSLSLEEIREAVLELEHEEKIRLQEPPVQGSFFQYVTKSYYSAVPLWLSLIAVSISLITLYFLPPDITAFSTVRVIAGSAIVFVIPGYGLVGLIFPRKEMSIIERIGLGIMLSLAIVSILWITLDRLNLGSETNTIVSSMGIAGILLITGSTYHKFKVNRISRENSK